MPGSGKLLDGTGILCDGVWIWLAETRMGPGIYYMSIWDGLGELWDRYTAWPAVKL